MAQGASPGDAPTSTVRELESGLALGLRIANKTRRMTIRPPPQTPLRQRHGEQITVVIQDVNGKILLKFEQRRNSLYRNKVG